MHFLCGHVCVFTLVLYVLIKRLCKPSLTRCSTPRCAVLHCSSGTRQTQKGIITFLPKQRNSMHYLRYGRWAPIDAWTAQDSVRENLKAKGAQPGNEGGISRERVRGEIKWQKSRKEGVGSGKRGACLYTDFAKCGFLHASIYHWGKKLKPH